MLRRSGRIRLPTFKPSTTRSYLHLVASDRLEANKLSSFGIHSLPEDWWLETNLLVLVLVVVVVAGIWLFAKLPVIFVIRIHQGFPVASRGKVTEAFLVEIAQLCRELEIVSGEIRGIVQGNRIALRFSKELPGSFCQRLRNWWAISGWPPKPNRSFR
jgi:hypothetical protein